MRHAQRAVVMDLSYALDHQPGEVVELEYAEDKVIKDLLEDGNWKQAFETPSLKFSTPDKRKIKCRLSEQRQGGYNEMLEDGVDGLQEDTPMFWSRTKECLLQQQKVYCGRCPAALLLGCSKPSCG